MYSLSQISQEVPVDCMMKRCWFTIQEIDMMIGVTPPPPPPAPHHLSPGGREPYAITASQVNVMDPSFKVYAPWRDPVLLEEFPGRTQMLSFLQKCPGAVGVGSGAHGMTIRP